MTRSSAERSGSGPMAEPSIAHPWFAAVVASLVLCTVRDPARALAEVRRVLRRGGELRFCEHVRVGNRLGALVQDALTPVWQLIAAGCHPNRDTVEGIREAGFVVER